MSSVSVQITMKLKFVEDELERLNWEILDLHQTILDRLVEIVCPNAGDKSNPKTESEFEKVTIRIIHAIGCLACHKHTRTCLARERREKFGTTYTVADFERYLEKKRRIIKKLNAWLYASPVDAVQRWIKASESAYTTRTISGAMREHLVKLMAECEEMEKANERRSDYLRR